MKNITYSYLVLLLILFGACKEKNKTNNKDIPTTKTEKFYLNSYRSSINWTAYKTTDKIPVNGKFKEVTLNQKGGETIVEALNNFDFEIPIASIFTNNPDRDYKLKEIFFGKLIDSAVLKGNLEVIDEENGIFTLSMNGIKKTFPATMNIKGNKVDFNATMKLSQWQTELAVKAINEACYELHKGPDGISMIWDEVDLNITSFLDKK